MRFSGSIILLRYLAVSLLIVLVGCPRKHSESQTPLTAPEKINTETTVTAHETTAKEVATTSPPVMPDATKSQIEEPKATDDMPAATSPPQPSMRSEKFVVFTPSGPLIVQLEITVRNRPLDEVIDSLLERILDTLSEGNEALPWSKLLEDPTIASGQLGNVSIDKRTIRRRMIEYYDTNRDGNVQREELRPFLTQIRNSDRLFLVQSSEAVQNGTSKESPLWALLDANENGCLEAEELVAASDRIHSRDRDDNEMVSLTDLINPDDPEENSRRRTRLGPKQGAALHPGTTDSVFYSLCELSGSNNDLLPTAFRMASRLPKILDHDGNGRIDQTEIKGLVDADPDLKLHASFLSEKEPKERAMIECLEIGDNLKQSGAIVDAVNGRLNITFENWTFDVIAIDQAEDFPLTLDSNVGIDKLPRLSSLQMLVRVEPGVDPLFDCLDVNEDSLLSLREIRDAGARLAALDKNLDGEIRIAEVPMTLSCQVIRGSVRGNQRSPAPMPPPAVVKPAGQLPDWLMAMDQNGDGEISDREFLGRPEKFRELDKNQDGFLGPKEFEDK